MVATAQRPDSLNPVNAAPPGEEAPAAFQPIPRANISDEIDALLTVPSGYIDGTVDHRSLQTVLRSLAGGSRALFGTFKINGMAAFDEHNKPVFGKKFTKRTRRLTVLLTDDQGSSFRIDSIGAFWSWKPFQDNLPCEVTLLINKAKQFGGDTYLVAGPVPKGRMQDIIGSIAPVYAGIGGAVKGERLTDCIDFAVGAAQVNKQLWLDARRRILEEACASEKDLLAVSNTGATNLAVILRALHRPTTMEEGALAREAVVAIAAAAVSSRSQQFFAGRPASAEAAIPGTRSSVSNVIAELGDQHQITLTKNQLQCIAALSTAFEAPQPSAHMLNGDVGTGKTLTFLVPAIAAFRRGKKVAIMAPTGILADQLALEMVKRFASTPVARIEAGGKVPSERAILIGTPGLVSVCRKAKWSPDVLIIDEQHKMPAPVREAMVTEHTHVIEATATPIPRSMAIAMYAGTTQLVLSENPVEKTLLTNAVFGADSASLSRMIRNVLAEKNKVAIIYPCVKPKKAKEAAEGSDDDTPPPPQDKATVMESYERMNAKFPGRVAKLYGDMPDEQQRSEIAAMRSGEKSILIASSLVEVGIDIPDLNGMIVCDADRFGLSQLHQLRGRLARKGGVGHFMLQIRKERDDCDPATVTRMNSMEQIADGFRLAEVDMEQRGFGDTAGDQQSGKIYTIFRGINLSPRDFLKLSLPNYDAHRDMREREANLPDAGEPEEVVTEAGQMSLL